MNNVENWCSGKPEAVKMMAKYLVANLEGIDPILRMTRKGQLDDVLSVDDKGVWCKLYMRSKRMNRQFAGKFMGSNSVYEIKQIESLEIDIPVLNDGLMENEAMQSKFEAYVDELLDPPADGDPASRELWMVVAFQLRVNIPCLLCHGKLPGALLRQARLGDYESLIDLLKLDRFAVNDSQIMRQVQGIVSGSNTTKRDQVLDAMKKNWPILPSHTRLKATAGALLMLLADFSGAKLGSGDIRNLFDAISCDNAGSFVIDSGLPDSQETWAQSVHRARKMLLGFIGITLNQWRELTAEMKAS